jgi:hypothetical protein
MSQHRTDKQETVNYFVLQIYLLCHLVTAKKSQAAVQLKAGVSMHVRSVGETRNLSLISQSTKCQKCGSAVVLAGRSQEAAARQVLDEDEAAEKLEAPPGVA